MSQQEKEPRYAEVTPMGLESAEKYAREPSGITAAERLLYGNMAGVVRLLGQASVAAEDAYSLACRYRAEYPAPADLPERPFANEAPLDALDKAVEEAWDVYAKARLTFRSVAARATAAFCDDVIVSRQIVAGGAFQVVDGELVKIEPTSTTATQLTRAEEREADRAARVAREEAASAAAAG